jgi:hypothetical protein
VAASPRVERIERIAGSSLTLPILSVAAFAFILWLGRDATFTADELIWIIDGQDANLRDLLEPSNGHLILVSRLVYAGILDIQGTDYFVFRMLAALCVILITWVFYLYARPRVGPVVALAPCIPLLVFGSSAGHVLVGNGFTVLLALSCGLAAFALMAGDRPFAPMVACVLLCLGVATFSVALAFVVGVAVLIAAQRAWRRLWVPAIPAVLYFAWWLWASTSGTTSSSDDVIALDNLLVLPAWLFQLLGYTLAAFSGLAGGWGSEEFRPALAAALAVVGVGAYVWWLKDARPTPAAVGALATFVALSALGVLVASFIREPDDTRYLYPATIAVLAILVEALAGRRLPSRTVIGLYVVVAVSAAANILQLTNLSDFQRANSTPGLRAALGALELSTPSTDPNFAPEEFEGEGDVTAVTLAWDNGVFKESPTADYLSMVGEHGTIGFSESELRAESDYVRTIADRYLAAALGLRLEPVPAEEAPCRPTGPARSVFVVDPGQELILAADGEAPVFVRRFADAIGAEIGTLTADSPATLRLPPDELEGQWVIFTEGAPFRICASR